MSGDLVSLRILSVFASGQDRDLLRQGAGAVSLPIDVLEAESAGAACNMLAANEIDIAFLDSAITDEERATFVTAARSAKPAPFVIAVAASKAEASGLVSAAGIDGAVLKPTTPEEAKALIERCIRVRLPNRVLVVDDSSTMRSIVRKILVASRYRLDIFEAQEGIEALKHIASGKFDLVFLDYNMPGLNGVETLSEIKRQYPRLEVVIMTSLQDEAVAERARAAGAAAFLKKPFYPSDIDAILHSVFGLRSSR